VGDATPLTLVELSAPCPATVKAALANRRTGPSSCFFDDESWALILRHDRADSACLADEAEWPSIVSFFDGDGGGSLVAPSWILTAAHTAANIPRGHEIVIGGRPRTVVETRLHPSSGTDAAVDLALVRVAPSVEDVTPLPVYERSDELGKRVLLLGRGDFGNGRDGVVGVDHRLRLVTNRVDRCDRRWLGLRFDPPPRCTSLEGVCGEGDSGGPALVRGRGGLSIVGVSSWQDHVGPLGTYGCTEYYARVSTSAAWIQELVR